MSGDPYTARATAREATKLAISEIDLPLNASGQYTFDAISSFMSQLNRKLAEMHHPNTKGEGMLPLASDKTTILTKIKSTDYADPEILLKDSRDAAKAKQAQTNMPEDPSLQSMSEAIELAATKNYSIQSTIGTKVGAAEAITEKVGSAITDAVLRRADGDGMKSPDDYTLHEVIQAAIAGAIRPPIEDVLQQFLSLVNYNFDFTKTVAQNMEQLRAKAQKIQAYGVTFDETHQFVTLMANLNIAAKEDWGRELRSAVSHIRQTYKYSHVHDATSMTAVLAELAKADAIRNLQDAPTSLSGAANAVQDSVSLLTQMMQEAHDYEEEANAVHSDSESSAETKSRKKPAKRSGRSKDRRTYRRNRSKSRARSDSEDEEEVTCKHCLKYHRKKAHPWLSEKKCGWNSAYKGWRPKWMCEELGIEYQGRHNFTESMGGSKPDDE